MIDLIAVLRLALLGVSIILLVASILFIRSVPPKPKPSTKFLRGFKYGDIVTIAPDPPPTTYFPRMILSVRVDGSDSTLPIERVTTIRLADGFVDEELYASIWRKVDA